MNMDYKNFLPASLRPISEVIPSLDNFTIAPSLISILRNTSSYYFGYMTESTWKKKSVTNLHDTWITLWNTGNYSIWTNYIPIG